MRGPVVPSPRVAFVLSIALAVGPFLTATWSQSVKSQNPSVNVARPTRPGGQITRKTGPVKVMVELDDEPAVRTFAAARNRMAQRQATSAGRNQMARIEQAQQRIMKPLADAQASIIYRAQKAFNGIAIKVDASKLEEIKKLPGVKSIHPIVSKYPTNATSVPFINAPQVWDAAGLNVHGEGIKIGIIDTGIDYTHTDFGGNASSTFPTAKVVGGFDFVGNAYNGISNDTPVPDPDPRDCFGHGTHVSGTAAGYGVNADGTTYTGSYGSSTPFASMKIGPGVAPKADIYALKVFGCSGASDIVDQAIEWAVDPNNDGDFSDHLDVINMSLGSPFGSDFDSTAVASDNAAALGVIVVAAAGNSGDTYYIDGSPGSSGRTISVAATGHTTDTLAAFSARGPRRGDSFLKPDIAAPGVGIFSAAINQGSGGTTMNGTSMATPHVAGTMALLRQLHPSTISWTVEQLKALAMNTATHDIPPFGVGRIGEGRIDVAQAAADQVIAYNNDGQGLVSVSFGVTDVVGDFSATKSIRVANKSNTPVTYNVAYVNSVDVPGVDFSLPDGPVVTVPAFGAVDIRVQMTATASLMKHTHDATVGTSSNRQWISEEGGYVVFAANGLQTLRVPVYAVPRPSSNMHSSANSLNFGGGISGTINLTGQDVSTGSNFPTDEVSIVSAFELQQSSPANTTLLGLTNAADLKYVGVASNFATAGSLTNTMIDFGIATQADWSSPNDVRIAIFIDTNRDGTDDFVLANIGSTGQGNDFFNATLTNLHTSATAIQPLNGILGGDRDTYLFNTNVMVLPVKASDLGLSAGNTKFNYRVQTNQIELPDTTLVDVSNTLTYDAADPGLSFSSTVAGTSASLDLNGSAITVNFDSAAFAAGQSLGALLLHHHNARHNREEVVNVVGGPPTILNLSPPTAIVGGPAFTLTVNGSNYVGSSVVRWNGSDRTTTFVSDTQLTAAISAADIAVTGTANVTVFNPGVGQTAPMSFAINNPGPTLRGMAPWLVSPGSPDFTLLVRGTNFIPSSTVLFRGVSRPATFVSGNVLTINLTASDVAVAGIGSIVVTNPQPGGGTSNSKNLLISTQLYGDLNGDHKVNVNDLLTMANLLAGNILIDMPAADVLQDAQVNVQDLLVLANFLAGNIQSLPVKP